MREENDYQISSGELDVRINCQGAELRSIVDKTSGFEYLWQANPSVWNRCAPVLFPIVGKLNQNKIQIEGKTFEMSQHGFARDKGFEMVELYQDTIRFMLESDAETQLKYPYDFRFFISYQLKGNTLEISYSVMNTGVIPLYFSVGAHPAFNIPGKDLSKYELVFEKPEILDRYLLKEGLFTGVSENLGNPTQILSLRNQLFEKDAVIFKNLTSEYLNLIEKGSNYKIALRFKEFPCLGIWAKYPNQHFVCLEPWVGHADSVNFSDDISKKEGMLRLEPQSIKSFTYSLSFFAP